MSDSKLHIIEYKYNNSLYKASYFDITVYNAIKEQHCDLIDMTYVGSEEDSVSTKN